MSICSRFWILYFESPKLWTNESAVDAYASSLAFLIIETKAVSSSHLSTYMPTMSNLEIKSASISSTKAAGLQAKPLKKHNSRLKNCDWPKHITCV